ncbi:MAG: autotransporter assembly complex protein TamA [Methylotenera sp.]
MQPPSDQAGRKPPNQTKTSSSQRLGKRLLICLLLWGWAAQADENRYQVEITAPAPLKALLQTHLQIIKWRDNPRMTPAEWQRLYTAAPQNIKDLLATEGYFSPEISPLLEKKNGTTIAKFTVDPGTPVLINNVDLKFTGAITQQSEKDIPSIQKLREAWSLQPGSPFRQEDWDKAKRQLLTSLLLERYPNATISNSAATVDLESQTVALSVETDSGPVIQFGTVSIEGLQRYPASTVENLNLIKPGKLYSQSELLTFQARLQESGYFRTVEVMADTKAASADAAPIKTAPIKVTVEENRAIKVGIGAGYSTNTGARTLLGFDNLNLLDLGWRLTSSLKVEQKAQSLNGLIRLPVTSEGYRDSINAGLDHTSIEGLTTTSGQAGVKRAWGPRRREQYIGANYLIERQDIDGAASSTKKAATLAYGITLRHTDNDLAPTRGYLFNAQFAGAPLESLSDGRFLQSYVKAQGYYPITRSTQLIARAEGGMVNGRNSAPNAFLFRAGGDQSVRGYAYQSLGVKEGDAIVGGRYLATGSVEIVQWLTNQWGAAVFVDFGNAANRIQELKPVYGYGLGTRWKSPLGPIGADIAYGQDTGEYRLHFNIGVAF